MESFKIVQKSNNDIIAVAYFKKKKNEKNYIINVSDFISIKDKLRYKL